MIAIAFALCLPLLQCGEPEHDDPRIESVLADLCKASADENPRQSTRVLQLLKQLATLRNCDPDEYTASSGGIFERLTDVRAVDLGGHVLLMGRGGTDVPKSPNLIQLAVLDRGGRIADRVSFWVNSRYGSLDVETLEARPGVEGERFVVRFHPHADPLIMNSDVYYFISNGLSQYNHPLRASLPSGKISSQDIGVIEEAGGALDVIYPRPIESETIIRKFENIKDTPAN